MEARATDALKLLVVAAGLSLTGCATNHFVLENPFYQGEAQEASEMTAQAAPEQNMQEASSKPAMPATAPQSVGGTGLYYRPDSRDQQRAAGLPMEAPVTRFAPHRNAYQPDFTHKSLQQYAEQLSMDLIDRAKWLETDSTVGVASFVTLDESLRNSSVLGNQLSEYCMSEIQAFGLSVIDFKVANMLSVGSAGDFVFSRDADALAGKLAIDYVMSGTMITSDSGVRVNARIIALDSRVVVASASVLIPHFIAEELAPETTYISTVSP